MLPLPNCPSQLKDRGFHGNPRSAMTAFDFKKAFNFLRSHVSFYHFAWALVIFLLEFCIFLAFTATTRAPSLPPTAADRLSPIHPQLQETQQQQQLLPPPPEQVSQQLLVPPHRPDGADDQAHCRYGRVYVYDLPPIFNKKLLENCHDLDPRKSQCPAVSNGGFGPKATTLAGTVPRELARAWYWTDLFAGEIIFHARISTHRCRTMEPGSAAAFYVPFYAGLAVSKYLFTNYAAEERDAPCQDLLRWIKGQPHWKRSNGSDHFLMLGRSSWDFRRARDQDWGTSFLLMPLMRQMFRLSIEKSLGDPLEVSVPYPSGFHPRTASEVGRWQEFVRSRKRSSLFTFVGGKRGYIRNDFRALLLDQCYRESGSCKAVDCNKTPCLDGAPAVLEAFLDSDFCLQPRGDSVTRRSTFDCMLAGSIPVFFWEGTVGGQYEMFMSDQPESFSVFIHRNEVRNGTSIRRVLEGYSREAIKRMREEVIGMIPRISYAFPVPGGGLGNVKDAFDIGLEEVLRRIVRKKKKPVHAAGRVS